jgi:hypothetical protein
MGDSSENSFQFSVFSFQSGSLDWQLKTENYFRENRLSRLLRIIEHLAVSHVIVVAVGQDALPNPG